MNDSSNKQGIQTTKMNIVSLSSESNLPVFDEGFFPTEGAPGNGMPEVRRSIARIRKNITPRAELHACMEVRQRQALGEKGQ